MVEKVPGKVPHTERKRLRRVANCNVIVQCGSMPAPHRPADGRETHRRSSCIRRGRARRQGSHAQLTVRAKYSDGTDRDVTGLAFFLSSNDNAAAVSKDGMVTAGNRGEASSWPASKSQRRRAVHRAAQELAFNFGRITGKQLHRRADIHQTQKLCIQPSELCNDESISAALVSTSSACCRLSRIPSSSSPMLTPRTGEKLVDKLLARKEFVELWVMKWSELLQMRSSNRELQGHAPLLQLAARTNRQQRAN